MVGTGRGAREGIIIKSAEALENFHGTNRRFEHKGTIGGVTIIDDYAHHPTEIKCTLSSAKPLTKGDVWCVFQPHTYSRTKAFLPEFAEALSIADKTIIADVYPAREKYDGTIHSCDLASLVKGSVYINDFDAIKRYILKNANKMLQDKSMLAFEIGCTQGKALKKIAKTYFPKAKVKIEKAPEQENYVLSSAQKRIYYNSKMIGENNIVYNIPGGIIVDKIPSLLKYKYIEFFPPINHKYYSI